MRFDEGLQRATEQQRRAKLGPGGKLRMVPHSYGLKPTYTIQQLGRAMSAAQMKERPPASPEQRAMFANFNRIKEAP